MKNMAVTTDVEKEVKRLHRDAFDLTVFKHSLNNSNKWDSIMHDIIYQQKQNNC